MFAMARPLHDGRPMMKHITPLAFALSLLVTGCKKGPDLDALGKLKDEACACKDKACAESVNKKLDDAVEQMAKDMGDKEPDEATQKKLLDVMTESGVCLAKLMK